MTSEPLIYIYIYRIKHGGLDLSVDAVVYYDFVSLGLKDFTMKR